MKPLVIGIAGKSGSGKTTVAHELAQSVNLDDVVVIKFDDYYKNQDELSLTQRKKTNYDHPNAFDMDLLLNQINDLIKQKSINKPIYDYVNHTRSNEYETISPKRVIILEGIFMLLEPQLRDLLDIKVFVDTDDDECFIRRLQRDINQRGRDIDNVINQYLTSVKPMAQQFVEPTKKYADFIIPRGGGNKIAIEMISNCIEKFIKEQHE